MKETFKTFLAEEPYRQKKTNKTGPAKYYGVSKGKDNNLYTVTSLDDNMKPVDLKSDLTADAAKAIVQKYESEGLKRIGSSDLEGASAAQTTTSQPSPEAPKSADQTATPQQNTVGIGKIDPSIMDDVKRLPKMTSEEALASVFKWIKYGAIDLNAFTHLMKGLIAH